VGERKKEREREREANVAEREKEGVREDGTDGGLMRTWNGEEKERNARTPLPRRLIESA